MKTTALLALVLAGTACGSPQVAEPTPPASAPTITVLSPSEVEWQQLNPARGDQSPKAATLWGDRNGSGPTGFLLRPVDGFRSPPHAHNVSYRGVVIRGLIHNEAPDAEDSWMPAGSFWTQPKGGVHITAAKGSDTLAIIEIDEGPYLVLPVDKAFDSDEEPRNVDASSIAWATPPGAKDSGGGSRVAPLWGSPQDGQANGSLIELPAGFTGEVRAHFRAVVVQGRIVHRGPGAEPKTLEPGSYVSSPGPSVFPVSCAAGQDCILYVRAAGELDLKTMP